MKTPNKKHRRYTPMQSHRRRRKKSSAPPSRGPPPTPGGRRWVASFRHYRTGKVYYAADYGHRGWPLG